MTATPSDDPNNQEQAADTGQEINAAELLRSLRRKEGTWVEWGQSCQQLQKAGYTHQQIFEETGFEPTQQNQITVATQVYQSIISAGVSDAVQSRFLHSGSDTLYEFRILTQPERAAAATLTVEKGIDSEGARDIAKALKNYSRLSEPPEEFSGFPGDAVAYHFWKLARQQSDLQERSRLIAQGLRFAQSEPARQTIEKLLTDFTVTPRRPAPILPIYRLESEEELPRILPVAGTLPLATDDFKSVPLVDAEGEFQLVRFSGVGAWVAVPGWQVVLKMEDPVALLAPSDQVPLPSPTSSKEVLVIVDRAERQWNVDGYFLVDQDGQLQIQWFEDAPKLTILGRVMLVMRPKKILDEDYTKEIWQLDE